MNNMPKKNTAEANLHLARKGEEFLKQPITIKHDCGEVLEREDVGYSQTTDILYHVSFDEDGYVNEYDEYDRVVGDGGEFYCQGCGERLTPEEKDALGIRE